MKGHFLSENFSLPKTSDCYLAKVPIEPVFIKAKVIETLINRAVTLFVANNIL